MWHSWRSPTAVTWPHTWPLASSFLEEEGLLTTIQPHHTSLLPPSQHRYTLSHSNVGVASLVCALYPCFPSHSTDNCYHLQALRHLYVLASRPGVLLTREALTSQPCCVSVRVTSREGGGGGEGPVRESVTPCFVQDWDELEKVRGERGGREWEIVLQIELRSDDYWPVSIDLSAAGEDGVR